MTVKDAMEIIPRLKHGWDNEDLQLPDVEEGVEAATVLVDEVKRLRQIIKDAEREIDALGGNSEDLYA